LKKYTVGIVGATGAVGCELLKILEQRDFPVGELRLFASERSAGLLREFAGRSITVRALDASLFPGIDVAFFSAGSPVSREFCPILSSHGALVVDNSSAFRSEKSIPLVIPEVNGQEARGKRGIIANPNCSTIQLVMAVEPIHRNYGIEQLFVATYQSVSGTGGKAMLELQKQTLAHLEGRLLEKQVYPKEIAFNLFPHIGDFDDTGLNFEERKIVYETRRFLRDDKLKVLVTAARVPVFRCHSEAVSIITKKKVTTAGVRGVLSSLPGVCLMDGTGVDSYSTPRSAEGKDEVFVGRLRETEPEGHGIAMWIVSDNLRKGAALNAVQIAETALGLK